MKVQALSRSQASTQRECSGDLRKFHRNLNPNYHPMARAREYTRAVTAAKLDRMFAKPLIGNLGNGHGDAVYQTCISRTSLLPLLSGAADGTVHLWDLPTRSCVATLNAHTQSVQGLAFGKDDDFYSCGKEGILRRWSVPQILAASSASSSSSYRTASSNSEIQQPQAELNKAPIDTWRISGTFQSIDHHWTERQFVTASDSAVQIWSPERSAPLQTHSKLWGSEDTVHVVRCHPSEPHLVAHCSMDRGIGLHDIRTASGLTKTVLRMRSNDLQWNPMEPLNFAVANEDYQAYVFDMRRLKEPSHIYKGHVSAVMSLAWAPTGREFVTGSYDKTLRIFHTKHRNGTARDIYHTKRMQRVFTVQYTMDNTYIVSGSDDTNLRLWKARASETLGQATYREESVKQYRQKLIQQYEHLPQVKQIHRSRKIPKVIQKQTQQAIVQKESKERKHANRVKHSKPGTHSFSSERKQVVNKTMD